MRAALYARVSSEDQAREEKVSLPTQQVDMERHCQQKSYTPIQPYYIDVQSGSDRKSSRPQFERLLKDIAAGKVDVVVVWRPDRAFRDLWPAVRLKRAIDQANIEVEGVTQPFNRQTLGIWAWVAEQELENISERTRMGKLGQARRGEYNTGFAPYGYRYDKATKKLVVDDDEAAVVHLIYSLYLQGMPMRQIALKLNADTVPTKTLHAKTNKGKMGWMAMHVQRILTDTTYKGEAYYNKTGMGRNGKKFKRAEYEWIRIDCPPIVSEETFAAVQAMMANYKRCNLKKPKAFYLLHKLAYCAECGMPFKFTTRSAGGLGNDGRGHSFVRKRDYRYCRCFGMVHYPHRYNCRTPGHLRVDELEAVVWQAVATTFNNPQFIIEGANQLITEIDAADKWSSGQIGKLKRKLIEAQQEEDGVISLAARGLISEEQLQRRLAQMATEKDGWLDEYNRLQRAADSHLQREQVVKFVEQFCHDIGPRLNQLTKEERRDFLHSVVRRVWIDREGQITIEAAIGNLNPEQADQSTLAVTQASPGAGKEAGLQPARG